MWAIGQSNVHAGDAKLGISTKSSPHDEKNDHGSSLAAFEAHNAPLLKQLYCAQQTHTSKTSMLTDEDDGNGAEADPGEVLVAKKVH